MSGVPNQTGVKAMIDIATELRKRATLHESSELTKRAVIRKSPV